MRGVGEWLVVVVEVKEDIVVRRLGIASDGDRDVVPLGCGRLQRHRVDQGRERIDQAVDYALAVAEADRGLADRIQELGAGCIAAAVGFQHIVEYPGGHVGVARIGCDLHRQAGRVYRSVMLVQRAREQALGEVFAEGLGGLRVTGRGQEFPHLGELLVDDSRRSLLQARDLREGLRLLLGEPTLVVRVDESLGDGGRSEEHTSELQSLMRISYAVFCLKKKMKNMHSYAHILYRHTL